MAEGEDIDPDFGFLGQLFGPKGENEDLVVKLVTTVLLDYSYWRKNYFPDDPLVLTSSVKRHTETHRDRLFEMTSAMVARLRRSFPIYSPRYIGHQLSETTIASVVGAFAGTLYNCNNVTPEAGIETVEMEIDACNDILKLLGFKAPPPPEEAYRDHDQYKRDLASDFGWCHLTSGGTLANLEALWVARAVKFFPLALRDACREAGIDLQVARPRSASRLIYLENGLKRERATVSLASIESERELIEFRPMEVLRMLGKAAHLIATETDEGQREGRNPQDYLWHLLNESPHSPRKGFLRSPFQPKILATGAAHYSVVKAADILGLGRDAIVEVPMDVGFRMNAEALRSKLQEVRADPDTCILAVIGAAGTTEEGAVDHIDDIVQVRREWEAERDESFWIHVDAAWGGFIRSMFVDSRRDIQGTELTKPELEKILSEIQEDVLAKEPFKIDRGRRVDANPQAWLNRLIEKLEFAITNRGGNRDLPLPTIAQIQPFYDKALATEDYSEILTICEDVLHCAAINLGSRSWPGEKTYLDTQRRELMVREVQAATQMSLPIRGSTDKYVLKWPDKSVVGQSLIAIEDADSVTIDPHKMGYCVYPNGAVAYRSDLVRHFIKHEAPYITDQANRPQQATDADPESAGAHFPVRHVKSDDMGRKSPTTEAFARYILEGSRPGAAACSLWLSSKTLPFDNSGIGKLIASSLLSARTLYHYLENWNSCRDPVSPQGNLKFVLFSPDPPDTNIVIFAVAETKRAVGLPDFNALNNAIYKKFSILAEHGNRSFSYMQPYFLSKTDFKEPNYTYETLISFFSANGIDASPVDYEKYGVVVLRATVMNPYLMAMKKHSGKDLLFEFVSELEQETIRVLETWKALAGS